MKHVLLMALLILTRPDGAKVAIVLSQVTAVQTPIPGTGVCPSPAKTVVVTLSSNHCVVESYDEVEKKLEAAQ
jgi:hypothetical protein